MIEYNETMKLWLLKLLQAYEVDPGIYDAKIAFVIRAESDWAAREIAEDEGFGTQPGDWLNPLLTSCVELLPEGDEGVILDVCV